MEGGEGGRKEQMNEPESSDKPGRVILKTVVEYSSGLRQVLCQCLRNPSTLCEPCHP